MLGKKKSFGLIILILAWELLAYTTCEYFLPTRIHERIYKRHQGFVMDWVGYFNKDLFQALNLVGLALLLIYIGFSLVKNKQQIPGKK